MAGGNNSRTETALAGGMVPDANEAYPSADRLETHYRKAFEVFSGMSLDELARREAFVGRATGDLDAYADRLGTEKDSLGGFRMDLLPRILRPREWERIEAGIVQRTRAFGELVRDIYKDREILRAGVIPPELVFEDPAYRPELNGLPLPEACPVTIGAVDLIRSAEGRWMVLENRLSTPTGISHVIQIRRILAQALPELFARMPVLPVASFATRLAEALAETALAAPGERPLVVLLSEGERGRHFFEESFLARHMGIPLTRPEDFIVRDGQVFLKTIEGLHSVDVIYRRIEPPHLDPVAFACVNENGIPGLVHCLRRGSVRVVNTMGCSLADNRALLRHADEIIRFYTGEEAILPTVMTYHGFDQDQAEWISDHADSLTLKTLSHPDILERADPEAGKLLLQGKLGTLLERDPRLVVAQEIPPSSRLPVYRKGKTTLEPLALRCYGIMGRRPFVLPGGLTRLQGGGEETLSQGRQFQALKDTWTLRQKAPGRARGSRLESEIKTGEIPLTSRAAESFYWMGRYLERGSGLTRMLNTLEELRWGELSPGERELYAPLWLAISKATGGGKSRLSEAEVDPKTLVQALLLDESDPASARACFKSVRSNAKRIRSFITPEVWKGVHQSVELFSGPEKDLRGTVLHDFMESVTDAADRLYGTASRTLLHDAGWNFLLTGIHLERGLSHVVILADVLPRIARRQWQHLRDDSDLTALLRLLNAYDAYHRHYRSRAYLDRVAHLLWKAPLCTSSVRFAAASIGDALRSLDGDTVTGITPVPLLEKCVRFSRWIDDLPLGTLFPARARELDKGLSRSNLTAEETIEGAQAAHEQMQAFFETTHLALEDEFFSHHPRGEKGQAL